VVDGGGLPDGDGGAGGAETVAEEDALLVEVSSVELAEETDAEVGDGGGIEVGGGAGNEVGAGGGLDVGDGGGGAGTALLVAVAGASLLVGGSEGATLVGDADVGVTEVLLIVGVEEIVLVDGMVEAMLVGGEEAGGVNSSLVEVGGATDVGCTLVSVTVVEITDVVGAAEGVVNVLSGDPGNHVGTSVFPEYGPPGGPKEGSSGGPNGLEGPKAWLPDGPDDPGGPHDPPGGPNPPNPCRLFNDLS